MSGRQKMLSPIEYTTGIVLDNGTGQLRAGYAGESQPRVTIGNFVGWPKHENVIFDDVPPASRYFGNDAQERRGLLTLDYPMKHGVIKNWEEMVSVWEYTFGKLQASPRNYPVLLTDPPLNPLHNREMMAETMFEHFSVPGLFVATQAVLPLYAANVTTGCVVDSGEGVTHVVPVSQGRVIRSSILRVNLGGRDLTNYLLRLLTGRGFVFWTSGEIEITREIKETLCYVSQSFEEEMQAYKANPTDYAYYFPDGQSVRLGSERFLCPEALFQPYLIGKQYPGVAELAYECITECEIDERSNLFQNILLTGGNSMMPGIDYRMEKEISELNMAAIGNHVPVQVSAVHDSLNAVWTGGSILASREPFQSMWITRALYDEFGPSFVHRQCL